MSKDRLQVCLRPHRHAAGAVRVRVHLAGPEEVLLGILVGAQRQHIEALGAGNLYHAGNRLLHGGPAEVMAQERVRRLPTNSAGQRLGRWGAWAILTLIAAKKRDHSGLRRSAGERGLEQPRSPSGGDAGFGPPKQPAPSGFAPRLDLGRQFGQQALAIFRREAVTNGDGPRVESSDFIEQSVDGNCGPEANGFEPDLFGQVQEIDNPGHVYAIAHRAPRISFSFIRLTFSMLSDTGSTVGIRLADRLRRWGSVRLSDSRSDFGDA